MSKAQQPIIGIPIPLDYFHREPLWGNAGGYRAVIEIVQAIENAGGDAQLLFPGLDHPPIDGLILPGGGDIHPLAYGQEASHLTTDHDQELDAFQLRWARFAFQAGMPMMGICRGMQVMNVAAGGSLIQHLPTANTHFPQAVGDDASLRPHPVHSITIQQDSLLAQLIGPGPCSVNSLHHQAVERLGSNLKETACADDGVIESIECAQAWQIGVQFHPEDLRHTDSRFSQLFKGLVDAAAS